MDDRHCVLYLRNMLATFGEKSQIKQSPRYRDSQTAIGWDEELCALYDAIAAEDHSSIATQAERSRNDNSSKLAQHSSGKNGPMDQRDDYQEAKITNKRDCMRSMGRATPKSIPKIKFDNDEVNNSLGPKRVLSVSTRTRVGGGTTIHQQVLHPQVWQAASWWKSSSWNDRFFKTDSWFFAYTQGRFPCKRRCVYTRHQTRTQCRSPAHVIFSPVV